MSTPENPQKHSEHEIAARQVITMVRWLLYLVFVVIGFVILRRLAPVLTPILAAGGIAYLLDPLVDRLEARGVKRVWAVTMLLVLFLGSLVSAVVFLAPLVADDLERFITNLPRMIENAATWVANRTGYEVPESWQEYLKSDEAKAFLIELAGPATSIATAAVGGFFSFLGFLAELLLIPVFAFYFLLDWDHIVARVRAMIPPRHRVHVVDIVGEIDGVVSSWLRGQFTVVAILAILYAICFYIVQVPLAITIGLLVGLLTIIPFLGTFVGAGITVVLILLDWQGGTQLFWVGLIFVLLHLLEAAVLTPKIVGKKVGLGESGALFAVLAGGQLLGFAGVLLAVPLAASVAVLIRRLIRYYESSAFFGADDHDDSVKPTEDEVVEDILRGTPAAHAVLPAHAGKKAPDREDGDADDDDGDDDGDDDDDDDDDATEAADESEDS